jgi:16S rRNA (guanine527-N7)-methyltransferase
MSEGAGARLNVLLTEAGLDPLDSELDRKFENYLSLILRWNARINLTAIRDEESILSRHFVESIICARALPAGIASLLDFGSGAGFPGVPIGLCRPEIAVTLAESQNKKAAFLNEVVRSLGLSAKVYPQRAELLEESFDCVSLRAVDRMQSAVRAAARLVKPGGYLAVMTTDSELAEVHVSAGSEFAWSDPVRLLGVTERVLSLGKRSTKSI